VDFIIVLQYLFKLYGLKNLDPSSQKIRALQLYDKETKTIPEIARHLGVQEDTAAVYIIHALAAGANIDHKRLAEELGISSSLFGTWSSTLTSSITCLRELKDLNDNATYNQLRFLIACKIHGISV